jgi:hypothetical protein
MHSLESIPRPHTRLKIPAREDWGRETTCGREREGGGAKSYDGEKARSSITLSMLLDIRITTGNSYLLYISPPYILKRIDVMNSETSGFRKGRRI